MQPGTTDRDIDLAARARCDADVLFVQLEQPQEINEVTLDKAQRMQVGQLGVLKVQTAQGPDLVANFIDVGAKRPAGAAGGGIDARIAAPEFVLHLGTRELMQHGLHHGELVQIGIKKTGNDHAVTLSRQRWRRHCIYPPGKAGQSSQCVNSSTGTRGVWKVLTTAN